LYNIENRTDLNAFLPTNCFCIVDSATVEAKIFDGYDDITRGLISYAIFDTTCSTVLAVVNKIPGTTGLAEMLGNEIVLYPNPGSGALRISGLTEPVQLCVFDQQGRLLVSETTQTGLGDELLHALAPGGYQVRMTFSDKSVLTRRLLRY
jgi:hypothetical protein